MYARPLRHGCARCCGGRRRTCVRLRLWVAGHKRAKLIAGETSTKDIKPIEVLARAPISITCERHRNRVRRPFGLGLSQIVLLPLRTQLLQLLEIDIIPVRPTRRVDKQLTWREPPPPRAGRKDRRGCHGRQQATKRPGRRRRWKLFSSES